VNYLDYLARSLSKSEKELRKFLQRVLLEVSRIRIKQVVNWDRLVINLADTVEDINKIVNLLYERLIEIYGLYYPEFVEEFEGEIEEFAKVVLELFDRKKVAKKYNLPEESIGIDFDEEMVEITKSLAKRILDLIQLKSKITNKINKLLKENLPNTLELTGPLILAKLLSLAGSIEKLVNFPASTIQVLGAEKALFRHLMKGTPPPKHGVLFQHPLVNKAPKKIRGRIARSLAAKISIALKVDYFSKGKRFVADKLKKELDERVKSLYEELKSQK
jgi:nucleolar protein 56